MTSNSRVRRCPAGAGLLFAAVAFALGACVAAPASDRPAERLVAERPTAVRPVGPRPKFNRRLQIRRAEARRIGKDDEWVKRIVHPERRSALRNPVLVTVDVVRPFSDLTGTASPVIVLDGVTLADSIVHGTDSRRVHAVVSIADRRARPMRVQVGWLGALSVTLSEPVLIAPP